jgi:hypothetical protein
MPVNKTAPQRSYATTFPAAWGLGGGCSGILVPTGLMRMATLWEFGVIDRFFTTSCDPNMSHSIRLFSTFCLKKATKHNSFKKSLK